MSWLEALADPVRLRIVRHLARRGTASLPELAEAADVHRNTARPHVATLEDAGLLVRARPTPSGRGRPVVRYRLHDEWSPPTTDFQGLAELLAAALARAGASERELRRIGDDWGRWLLGRPAAGDVERPLSLALERLGFHAEAIEDELRLSACPCPLVSPERPELVCTLAAAVADGVLAGAGDERRVVERDHDPARRACTLSLGAPRSRRRLAGRR
jgi:predicted ArsR family transcriptional regulator